VRGKIVAASKRAYPRALVMWRTAAVAIAVLSACDFVACDGKYTETVMKILSAIERSFV